jgi:sugar O-acyltransferase (sialic acid O-acetyltransferase NeuD family)
VTRDILIYGAGGFAREVAWLVESCGESYRCRGFIDDDDSLYDEPLNGYPVMSLEAATATCPDAAVVPGVGDPSTRQLVMQRVVASGFSTATLVHPRTERSQWLAIGTGTVICAGCILTTNITIGQYVQINLDCTIGHDAILEDYVTLAPGVHVSGWVYIQQSVYIGTGAVILNGTRDGPIIIGEHAIIGAGACVTKSIPADTTAVGVPARPIQVPRG